MFTKLFKKSHDPYELGGRWYKIRVSFIGGNISVIKSDIQQSPDDPGPDLSYLAYYAHYEDTIYEVGILNGLVIDYIVDPLDDGTVVLDDIRSTVRSITGKRYSLISIPENSAIGTVDLYMYIV